MVGTFDSLGVLTEGFHCIHILASLVLAYLLTVSLLEHLTKRAGLAVIAQESKGEILWEHLWTLKQLPEDL